MGIHIDMVSELIDQVTYQWRVEKLRENFMALDVDRTMQIPLRHQGGPDWIAWALEKSGQYSVRSAYRALVESSVEQEMVEAGAASSSVSEKREVWKLVWKLDTVPKVQVFWWRVLKGILPDYSTLSRRHVREDSTCGICKNASENLLHALTECAHAKLFWTAAKDVLKVKLPRLHPETWASDILIEPWFTGRERAIVVTVMHSIWSSRNNWTHGGKVMIQRRRSSRSVRLF
jgi:hypothetical protein